MTFLATRCQYRRLDVDLLDDLGLYRVNNTTSDKVSGRDIGVDLGMVQMIIKGLSVLSTQLRVSPADNGDVAGFVNLLRTMLILSSLGSQVKLSDVVALDQVALFHYKLIT